MRPNALALSPDGNLLVTAGLTHELVVVDPAAGKFSQHVAFPADKAPEHAAGVADAILDADEKPQLSFTGLVFSPDGSRIYLSNVNGDIKVFGVGADHKVSPLFSIPLPPANAPRPRQMKFPPASRFRRMAKNFTSRSILPTGWPNWMRRREKFCGRGMSAWRRIDVVLAGNKVYVSNWGGRRPDADSVTGPAGEERVVRVDARSHRQRRLGFGD